MLYLLPCDPVFKKCNPFKRNYTEVSAVTTSCPGKRQKTGQGHTGVELRFHKKGEYAKLSEAQKDELQE